MIALGKMIIKDEINAMHLNHLRSNWSMQGMRQDQSGFTKLEKNKKYFGKEIRAIRCNPTIVRQLGKANAVQE